MSRTRLATRTGIRIAAATAIAVGLSGTPALAKETPAPTQLITVDGHQDGRVFDGVGALSAGASSRLLVDYPEPARGQILDYLFKPGYGASLQILKVEVGGDTNSTAGSEPSHQRGPDDLGCHRGYEWWLMHEAKRRNPNLQLAGLSWGAPGWFRGGFWSSDNIAYQISWLRCAREQGLTIDYVGGWNESETFDPNWFIAFKKALRDNGFHHTKLAAADQWGSDLATRWNVVDVMATNPEFAAAVDQVSVHYPCGQQFDGAPFDHCPSTEAAMASGKPLSSGEQGSQQYDIGAAPLAKAINRSYIDGRMTSTVNWSAVASWYTATYYAGAGLMRAYQPWSGYYEASKSLWSVAHTTQFASPGWRYLDSASGYLDGRGSVTTLREPGSGDYSMVLETVDATAPQTVRVAVDGGLSEGRVHIWETDLASDRTADWFRHAGTTRPQDGELSLTLRPGRLYTITTTTGQGKGNAAAPSRADTTMRLPYGDDFDRYRPGSTARLLADFNGAFETAPCQGGRGGLCLAQRITTEPIWWRYATHTTPLTTVGDPNWAGDYAVGVDAHLDQAPYVDLIGRADAVLLGAGGQPGYRLRLARDGTWQLIEQAPNKAETVLATGRADRFDVHRWHRLGLSFEDTRIEATLDGRRIASVDDTRHDRGQVGLLVGDWATAQFDDLVITPTAPAPRLVPQNQLRATATSEQVGYDAGNVLDANPSSMWHSPWSHPAPLPQAITLDLGRDRHVRALRYTPRYDANPNGNATAYTLHTSRDGRTFTPAGGGTWTADATTKTVWLPAGTGEIRYLRLEITQGGNGYATAAELNVLE